MKLEDIINISGKPGLFKIISRTQNGLIAESLENQKRIPVFATDNVSAFTDISIYTTEDSVSLKELFRNISKKENGGAAAIDPNADANTLKGYFKEVLPDYDEDQVYNSHIKKVLKWYNVLHEAKLLEELLKEEEEPKDGEPGQEVSKAAQFEQNKNQPKGHNVKASSKAKGGVKTPMPRKAS
jgi:hypothetical protein